MKGGLPYFYLNQPSKFLFVLLNLQGQKGWVLDLIEFHRFFYWLRSFLNLDSVPLRNWIALTLDWIAYCSKSHFGRLET